MKRSNANNLFDLRYLNRVNVTGEMSAKKKLPRDNKTSSLITPAGALICLVHSVHFFFF